MYYGLVTVDPPEILRFGATGPDLPAFLLYLRTAFFDAGRTIKNFSSEFFFPNSILLCSFLWTVECIHEGYHEGLRETPFYHEGLQEV